MHFPYKMLQCHIHLIFLVIHVLQRKWELDLSFPCMHFHFFAKIKLWDLHLNINISFFMVLQHQQAHICIRFHSERIWLLFFLFKSPMIMEWRLYHDPWDFCIEFIVVSWSCIISMIFSTKISKLSINYAWAHTYIIPLELFFFCIFPSCGRKKWKM